jgi:hypothetical protein
MHVYLAVRTNEHQQSFLRSRLFITATVLINAVLAAITIEPIMMRHRQQHIRNVVIAL